MPKEVVRADAGAPPDAIGGYTVVEIGWNRETGTVQLVTKALNDLGGRLSDDEGIHYTDGMYAHLDRRGINDLIRHLRRARDAAFGRDE